MADDPDIIAIESTYRDGASSGLRRTARNLEDLTDEVDRSNESMAQMEEQQEDTARQTDRLNRRLEKQKRHLNDQWRESRRLRMEIARNGDETGEWTRKLASNERAMERQRLSILRTQTALSNLASTTREVTEETSKLRREQDRTRRSTATSDGFLRRLWARMGQGGGVISKLTKKLFSFGRMLRLLFTGLKFVAIATGISFLGKAIAGLGAAGYAAVAGLTPLIGMLISYPALIGTAVQSMATFKLATSGMGELIKVMSDPAATAEQIAEATKNMSQSQIKFARAVVDSNEEFVKLKKNVGSRFFRGLATTYRELTREYFPVLDRYLGRQASMFNRLTKDGVEWLNSQKTMKDVGRIMKTNNRTSENYGRTVGSLIRLLTIMVSEASPMLRLMSRDLADFTRELADTADENRGGLRYFFLDSYNLLRDVFRVSGYYINGLINIGKQSDALNEWMGRSIDETGRNFEKWTASPEGAARTRKFFKDMIPITKELGYWVRDLANLAAGVSMDNDDFVTASVALREKAIPAIDKAFDLLADNTVPVLEKLAEMYKQYKDAGLIGGMGNALGILFDFLQKVGEFASGLPSSVKKLLAIGGTILALNKLIKLMFGINAVGGLMGLGKGQGLAGFAKGVQKVFVVNMVPGGLAATGARASTAAAATTGAAVAAGTRAAATRAPLLGRGGMLAALLTGAAFRRGVGKRAARPPKRGLGKFGKGVGIAGLALLALELSGSKSFKDAFSDANGTKSADNAAIGLGLGSLLGPQGAAVGLGLGALAPTSLGMQSGDVLVDQLRSVEGLSDALKASIDREGNTTDATRKALEGAYSQIGVDPKLVELVLGDQNKSNDLINRLYNRDPETASALRILTNTVLQDLDDAGKGRVTLSPMTPKQLKSFNRREAIVGDSPFFEPDDKPIIQQEKAMLRYKDMVKQARIEFKQLKSTANNWSKSSLSNKEQRDTNIVDQRAPKGVQMGGLAWTKSYTKVLNSITSRFNNLKDIAPKRVNFALKGLLAGLKELPPEVMTKIDTPGAINSMRDVKKLQKQYKLTPPQVVTLLKITGNEEAIRKAREIQAELAKIKDKRITIGINARRNFDDRFLGRYNDTLFTGGPTDPGKRYLTGELGPEAWISRTGQVKMLGLNGPEVGKLGAGAVLPASFTQNPFGGNAGLAPKWAQDIYRKAAAGTGAGDSISKPGVNKKRSRGERPISVDMSGWQVGGSGMDAREVARLAKKAVREALKEAEERK